jgi:hypothetical protein
MSCRHNLANGTCITCYPSNPFQRASADRIDPGPESSRRKHDYCLHRSHHLCRCR